MKERFVLDTRDRRGLLLAMIAALASPNARISFEGNLSKMELAELKGATNREDGPLKRATLQPKLDFVILPLADENLSAIRIAVHSIAFAKQEGITHIQIEHEGTIAFAAYDSFHRECVVASFPVNSALLDELTKTGILRSYKRVSS